MARHMNLLRLSALLARRGVSQRRGASDGESRISSLPHMLVMHRRRRTRVSTLALPSLVFAVACSDATGPAQRGGAWEYRPDASILSGNILATLTRDFVGLMSFGQPALAVIEPSTGREKFRVEPVTAGASLVLTGAVVVLRNPTNLTATYRVHDGTSGRLLFEERGQAANRQFYGVVGTTIIGSFGDTVLIGSDRETGRELWRRAVPAIPCVRFCGGLTFASVTGDEMLLTQSTDANGAIVRVRADGTLTQAVAARDAFRSSREPLIAARQSSTSPVVVATSRSLTSLDANTGATRWRVQFDSLVPRGFYSEPFRLHLTEDGGLLTLRVVDSTGTSLQPTRVLTLRTSDGVRVLERSLGAEEASDLLDAPCGASGRVRVLPDLRMEYTDLSSGRIQTSAPIARLSALRPTAIVSGSLAASSTTTAGRIIVYDGLTSRLFAEPCVL
jgi:hypothetical protein